MSDGYLRFSNRPLGKFICSKLGLPVPPMLQRADDKPWQLVDNIALESAPNGQFSPVMTQILSPIDSAATADLNGLVFDASGIVNSEQLEALYYVLSPKIHQLARNAKVVIVGLEPKSLIDIKHATAQRALLGFVKSLAKELGRKGSTANLIYATQGCGNELAAPLSFFCSLRNAYVTGQVVYVDKADIAATNQQQPLHGKLALVTGASQGIGLAMAQTLHRDGATVIGLDIAPQESALKVAMEQCEGESLALDISASDAGQHIEQHLNGRQLDIVVHNAGITRDKMLSRMKIEQWQLLMSINLTAIETVNDYLLGQDLIADGGRIIGVSSISGIGGNAGQTNYATAKAGVIGMVEALKDPLSEKGITINAVAPGFIETKMTAAVPFLPRQIARRACSLSQGGLPVDVAEAVALFASPQAQGLSGNVLRVCGQNIVGG